MELNNELMVDAPLERAWRLFDEIERVIPCMPGASFAGQEGDASRVAIKVKVGAILANFSGTVRFVECDAATHTALIQGTGRDTGGKGNASATIRVSLSPMSPQVTRIRVQTELGITGRLAQFGGSMLADIAGAMVKQFTANLNQLLASEGAPQSSIDGAEARMHGSTSDETPYVPEGVPSGSISVQDALLQQQVPAATTQGAEPNGNAPLDMGPVLTQMAVRAVRQYSPIAVLAFILGWLLGHFV